MKEKSSFPLSHVRTTNATAIPIKISSQAADNCASPSPEISPNFFLSDLSHDNKIPLRSTAPPPGNKPPHHHHQQHQEQHKLPVASDDQNNMFSKQPVPQRRNVSSALTAALSSIATSHDQRPDIDETTTPTQSVTTGTGPLKPALISSLKKAHSTDRLIFAFSQSRGGRSRRGGSVRFDLTDSQENLLTPVPPYVTRESSGIAAEDVIEGSGTDEAFDMTSNDDIDIDDDRQRSGDSGDESYTSTSAFFVDTPSREPSPSPCPPVDHESSCMASRATGTTCSTATSNDDTVRKAAKNESSQCVVVAIETSSSRTTAPEPTVGIAPAGREQSVRGEPLSLVLPTDTPCSHGPTGPTSPKGADLADKAALVREPGAVELSAAEQSAVDLQSLLSSPSLLAAWSRVWTTLVGSPKIAPTPTSTAAPTPDPHLPRSHPSSSWFPSASSKSSSKSRGSDKLSWPNSWKHSPRESTKGALGSFGGFRGSHKFNVKLFPSAKVESLNQATASGPVSVSVSGGGAEGDKAANAPPTMKVITTWMDLVGAPVPAPAPRVDKSTPRVASNRDNTTTFTMGTRGT